MKTRTKVLIGVGVAIAAAIYFRRRSAAAAQASSGSSGTMVDARTPSVGVPYSALGASVDDAGRPSPGPGWYLDYVDGRRQWLPVGAMN